MNLTLATPNHSKHPVILALVLLALFCSLAVCVQAVRSASFLPQAQTETALGSKESAISSQAYPAMIPVPEPPSNSIVNAIAPRAAAAPLNYQPKPIPQPVPTPDSQK